MTRQQLGQRHGIALAPPKLFEALFSKIDIFEVVELLDDGLPRIETLAAAGTPRKLSQSLRYQGATARLA
ncbi:hypothetical protein NXC14_CH01049 [Rhizobium sp. NXC14]|nr:hypothetical protein NXC14_CH01049 [Rhizobium sp. NXC14]